MTPDDLPRLLLIEDNPADVRLVKEALADHYGAHWKLEVRDRLSGGLECLKQGGVEAVLVDLSLPDCGGMEAVVKVHAAAPETPIVVLTGLDNDAISREAVKQGAQDFVIKGLPDAGRLSRALYYAIERKRTEKELREALDAALEAARVKSHFLETMSHEIRTPLNAIVGAAQLLLGTELGAEQRELAGTIWTSSEALLSLINDILDFSKLAASRGELEERQFELYDVMDSASELFAEQAQRKGVAFATYVDGAAPLALRGDPGRLRQILTSLVGNAVKFTEHGEVAVWVIPERESRSDIVLRFVVKDTGIGIASASLAHLFEPFPQTDSSTSPKYGGAGLGLAIARQLAGRMDGRIGVDSTPGVGSTFWFTARLGKGANASAWSPKLERVRGMRVLIAGSGCACSRIAAEQVKSWGVRTAIAADSSEALATLRNASAAGASFDAVLLDIHEESSGWLTLIDAVGADSALRNVKLLAMCPTGRPRDERVMRCCQVCGVLRKPLKPSQLLDTLGLALGERPTQTVNMDRNPVAASELLRDASPRVQERPERGRVLIVEDNPVNQRILEIMLKKLGYSSEIASNGVCAMDALAAGSYDAVLMDCLMPMMDGYQATREIRRGEANGRSTPIIGLTANALVGARERCMAAGMDDYLGKPVTLEGLAQTLDRWIAPKPAAAPSSDGVAPGGASADQVSAEGTEEMKGN